MDRGARHPERSHAALPPGLGPGQGSLRLPDRPSGRHGGRICRLGRRCPVGRPAGYVPARRVLLAASALLRWPPPEVGHLDRSPAVYWPEPHLVLEPGPDVGPVLVSVTYKVAPDNARAFLAAMDHLRRSRLRTGAVRWELYRDGSDPRTFVEQFLVPSWDEHLRQHRGRLTGADRAIEERAVALADEPPVVAHLFPPDLEALEPDGPASEG